jgi:hypothetical protein
VTGDKIEIGRGDLLVTTIEKTGGDWVEGSCVCVHVCVCVQCYLLTEHRLLV